MKYFRLLPTLVLATGVAVASHLADLTASSMGPLKVSSTNPRYFADPGGKVVYLAGSHNWDYLVDHGSTDPPTAFDDTAYLDLLSQEEHNFIKMWAFDLARYDCGKGSRYARPLPWSRPGPGTAQDGKPKFDLTKFNQAYFDRLRSRVIAARNRRMYVGVMLFEGVIPKKCDTVGGNPFRKENNINGINGDPNGDGKALEVYTLQDSAITRMQEGYIRKLIDTVNDLDNVLYEISNENHSGSDDWQYHLINYIKTYEAAKPKQHPVGMTGGPQIPNASLFASPADWISPASDPPGSRDRYSTNPPVVSGQKVVLLDTDHTYNNASGSWGTPESKADDVWVWKSFTRGYNPIYIDSYDFSQPDQVSSSAPNREAILSARAAMGQTIAYSKKLDLAAMTPSTSICSTTYCLVRAGSEYLVYSPSGGSFTVNLVGATYRYEWFNPTTGSVAGTGTLTASSGNRSFTPPFSGDAVLYLKKQ